LRGLKPPPFRRQLQHFFFFTFGKLRCLWQYVVSTAFIRDFLIGEADIGSFSCYSKPPASAGGAFTLGQYQTFQPAKDRLLGYERAYAEAGLEYDKKWAVAINVMDIESGRAAMEYLMRLSPRPTAVIAADDVLAFGAMIAAGNLGLKVPDDVSLVGTDNADFSSQIFPPFTTVHIPRKLIAQKAASYFTQVMDNSTKEVPTLRECLPISLIECESCAGMHNLTEIFSRVCLYRG
jgi:hypothetical protein